MANKKRQKKTKKPNLPRDVRAAKEAEIKNRGKKPGKKASKGANTAVMVVATVLLVLAALFANGSFGVRAVNLEANGRKRLEINEEWQASVSYGKHLGAVLFYDEADGFEVAIYENRPKLSFGFFPLYNSHEGAEARGLVRYTVPGYNEQVFVTLNPDHIVKAEIGEGEAAETIALEGDKPFALVTGRDKPVVFYDEAGQVVEPLPQK